LIEKKKNLYFFVIKLVHEPTRLLSSDFFDLLIMSRIGLTSTRDELSEAGSDYRF